MRGRWDVKSQHIGVGVKRHAIFASGIAVTTLGLIGDRVGLQLLGAKRQSIAPVATLASWLKLAYLLLSLNVTGIVLLEPLKGSQRLLSLA